MKNKLIQTAVWNMLGLVSMQAMATGLVDLPATGFAVGSEISPYTLCNTTNTPPTTSANNTCAVFPSNVNTAPESGYTLITSVTRNIVLNDSTHTNNSDVTVGSVWDRIWRKSSTNECIYGARITMNNVDYDLNTAGTQYLEINDLVRSGYSDRSVAAGYYYSGASQEVLLYRVGRTDISAPFSPAQPIVAINDNFVDFKTNEGVFFYKNGLKNKYSPVMYVKTSCSSATHTHTAGALTFRQTAQDPISFSISGFVPN
jgi:hypothetical protein